MRKMRNRITAAPGTIQIQVGIPFRAGGCGPNGGGTARATRISSDPSSTRNGLPHSGQWTMPPTILSGTCKLAPQEGQRVRLVGNTAFPFAPVGDGESAAGSTQATC